MAKATPEMATRVMAPIASPQQAGLAGDRAPLESVKEAGAKDLATHPGLSEAEVRLLRRAIGAPHQFDWADVESSDLLNPRHVKFEPHVTAAINSAAGRSGPILGQLGLEMAQTTRDELAELLAAGSAVVIKNGESAFTKVGDDAVCAKPLGGGEGIAARKRSMPRLLEVEGRLQAAGREAYLSVARAIVQEGLLSAEEMAIVESVVRSWKR
jgi:hypothetical protein